MMLDWLSLLLEIATMILGLLLATQKKKQYGWLIALTFGIYVIYDLSRFNNTPLPSEIGQVLFLIASLSIFLAVYRLYSKK